VIEQAGCPDQGAIGTTLEFVVAAIKEEGSRQPELLVLGNPYKVLYKADA